MCGSTCGCAAAETSTTNTATTTSGVTATYAVSGMTCGHCMNAGSTDVGAIPGVTDVPVDPAGGAVTVTGTAPIETGLVRAAVDEAGHELVSRP